MYSCLSHPPYWGPGPQPRYVPYWESSQQPFRSQASTPSTELHQPGQFSHPFQNIHAITVKHADSKAHTSHRCTRWVSPAEHTQVTGNQVEKQNIPSTLPKQLLKVMVALGKQEK